MSIFQTYDPRALGSRKKQLVSRLMGQYQNAGVGNAGQSAISGGTPFRGGNMQPNAAKVRSTQGSGINPSILSMLGATLPRALFGESSGQPGQALDWAFPARGTMQPDNVGNPDPGYGLMTPNHGGGTPGASPGFSQGLPPGYSQTPSTGQQTPPGQAVGGQYVDPYGQPIPLDGGLMQRRSTGWQGNPFDRIRGLYGRY